MIVGQQCEFQNILIILSFCVLINYRGYIKLQWDEKKKNLSLYRIIQVYEVINESSSSELKVILVWLWALVGFYILNKLEGGKWCLHVEHLIVLTSILLKTFCTKENS